MEIRAGHVGRIMNQYIPTTIVVLLASKNKSAIP